MPAAPSDKARTQWAHSAARSPEANATAGLQLSQVSSSVQETCRSVKAPLVLRFRLITLPSFLLSIQLLTTPTWRLGSTVQDSIFPPLLQKEVIHIGKRTWGRRYRAEQLTLSQRTLRAHEKKLLLPIVNKRALHRNLSMKIRFLHPKKNEMI